MENEIHNTHNISYSTVSDHEYKFDKDGNVIVDTLQDLIYDKGLTGEFGDKKKKEKFGFIFDKINKDFDNEKKEIKNDENDEDDDDLLKELNNENNN